MLRCLGTVALAIAGGPCLAAELPIRGVYGMTPADCQASRDENEGGYVAFEKSGTGEGGQGSCSFSSVSRTGPGRYSLTGTCRPLEGPKKRRTMTLVLRGRDDITYDGQDYRRCP